MDFTKSELGTIRHAINLAIDYELSFIDAYNGDKNEATNNSKKSIKKFRKLLLKLGYKKVDPTAGMKEVPISELFSKLKH